MFGQQSSWWFQLETREGVNWRQEGGAELVLDLLDGANHKSSKWVCPEDMRYQFSNLGETSGLKI